MRYLINFESQRTKANGGGTKEFLILVAISSLLFKRGPWVVIFDIDISEIFPPPAVTKETCNTTWSQTLKFLLSAVCPVVLAKYFAVIWRAMDVSRGVERDKIKEISNSWPEDESAQLISYFAFSNCPASIACSCLCHLFLAESLRSRFLSLFSVTLSTLHIHPTWRNWRWPSKKLLSSCQLVFL